MQPKTRILLTSVIILALLALFAFSTPGLPANPATREDACCKKAGTCTGKENKGGEDLMMENLSRQFIFISSYK